jgi:micrococcal nuclease
MSTLPSGPAYTYLAHVLDVHDGDTFTADIDLGFQAHYHTSIRLLGCNAIELEDPGGVETRNFLASLIEGHTVTLRTVKVDKFGGRYDAQCTLENGIDLVSFLMSTGWVAPWNGRGVKPVPPWPRTDH